ncbi:nucleotide exchange factor GrpE [Planococcus sp. APC 3906]|uniref:nucleotide exchange factor GrpE n=1 Tax=Planococcus sp. APC 3906 TaxID=3035194 RepID=UPI0025B36C34|nr:nucleotide exchange factor GrpE [Planococcus sp. APC 3906]MDN3449837.1 nucleotide exchange factor GrpE [Planococcus sp. APC 3906]
MAKKKQAPKTEETITEDVLQEESVAAGETIAEPADAEAPEAAAEEPAVDETEKLREELEAERNKYLRLMADFDNYKRRAVKDRQEAEKFRAQSVLVDLLPVLDNFERALAMGTGSEESSSLLKGVEMVQKSLLEAVKREGLEEIKSVGEAFDPNVHQAVMQEKDDSAEAGSVLMELQKGYTLKGRVLRPAMVKVNE